MATLQMKIDSVHAEFLSGNAVSTTVSTHSVVSRDSLGGIWANKLTSINLGLTHNVPTTDRTTDTVFYSSNGDTIYKNTAAGMRASLNFENSAMITAASANVASNIVVRDASGNFSAGVIDANGSALSSLNASNLTSGTVSSDRLNLIASDIPDLNASKITAGTLGTDRIPNLNASKIDAGTLDTARIPSLSANKITTDTFDAARIPTLNQNTTGSAASAAYASNAGQLDGYDSSQFLRSDVGGTVSDLITANRVKAYSGSYSAAYNNAAIEVREYNLNCTAGNAGTEWARAPRIGFHWCGRVASQLLLESSGRISVVNNPGNAYEQFGCGYLYNSGESYFGGKLGIGTTAPGEKIHLYNATTTARMIIERGSGSGECNLTLKGYHSSGSTEWQIYHSGSNAHLYFWRGGNRGYLQYAGSNYVLNFTGQHRTFIKDVPFTEAPDLEGLIVSADQNKYIKMSGGVEAGSNAITINESLPVVSLSNVATDKKCFGVISASEDPDTREDAYGNFVSVFQKELGDTRVYINSTGEGAIWVTNINGSLESGDYITTSNVAGYGMKQDSEFLANYTVAKITMDCDFSPATQPVQQIVKELSNVNYWINTIYSNVALEEYSNLAEENRRTVTTTQYSNDEGNISVAEYSNLESNAQATYSEIETTTYQKIECEESTTEKEGWTLEVREELVNVLDEHGQLKWEDHPTQTEKAYKIRYLTADGQVTDEANAIHIAAFVGCTYHCG